MRTIKFIVSFEYDDTKESAEEVEAKFSQDEYLNMFPCFVAVRVSACCERPLVGHLTDNQKECENCGNIQ